MDRITINIPSEPIQNQAADIVIATFREIGIDSRKALASDMARQIVGKWTRGEWTREQFMHACTNLLILNPALATSSGSTRS